MDRQILIKELLNHCFSYQPCITSSIKIDISAGLYDFVAMPPDLRRAHQALNKAVDAAYSKKSFASDAERVAFLFELYHKYTSLLPSPGNQLKTENKG